ncbi:MAG: hypothetical protein KZQ63_06970, partial [Candidatus Thiodiazotropha sp. (ex Lucinoma aequizonata)]|nr:hypothetical protein [Candidatus Thiodiazotropha sp. (ex Lucinoma aequizonata)]MCU7898062.1 hypothetical protein [Candidatus Thiodiazotropha sp. (ex Lucinoma aequizonata)]MCU7908569.1 hypothetical protein [Candidatus Thiodiazotropha sp. (ex Lucinoma aequizonata)]MCU7911830.1 hypothetical protein [Candidatus Thiodiazotropha sp. (ex Lucinoma aequizonata)]
MVIIQLKNWKKCLIRFFCIFSDFKEDCLSASISIHISSNKRVFDLVKDFGTSQSTKIDSIFDSLLCP